MPGDLQPLAQNFQIVDQSGFPTPYFIKWAQQRQIDITAGITAAQAQQLIDDWAAGRQIIAGAGLSGGGTLAANRTIDVNPGTGITVAGDAVGLTNTAVTPGTYGDATHVGQFTVDQQCRITAATNIAITGGGSGGYPYEALPTSTPVQTPFNTWRNQGSASITADSLGIYLSTPVSTDARILETNMLSVPFSYYARCDVYQNGSSGSTNFGVQGGFFLINSTSGRLVRCGISHQSPSSTAKNYAIGVERYTSVTTTTTGGWDRFELTPIKWIRIDVTSTTVTLFGSPDGKRWFSGPVETFSSFLTATGGTVDKFGIGIRSFGAAGDTGSIFYSVLQATQP